MKSLGRLARRLPLVSRTTRDRHRGFSDGAGPGGDQLAEVGGWDWDAAAPEKFLHLIFLEVSLRGLSQEHKSTTKS